MKSYPLKLEELHDEGDAMSLFSRGHHETEAFIAALIAQCGYADDCCPAGPVYQAWWRSIPPSEE